MTTVLLQATEASASIHWTEILMTLGTIVTGAGGVKIIKVISKNRKDKRAELHADSEELKDTLKTRVEELEDKVDSLQSKIDKMIDMYTGKILELSTTKAELLIKVEFLEKDNTEKDKTILELTKKLNQE